MAAILDDDLSHPYDWKLVGGPEEDEFEEEEEEEEEGL